ncbi:MAG: hypothetical protein ACJA08_003581 [Cyclobacteriaceae bacterium]|jgi:hypothetical protein
MWSELRPVTFKRPPYESKVETKNREDESFERVKPAYEKVKHITSNLKKIVR